jgi:hypothetical protein
MKKHEMKLLIPFEKAVLESEALNFLKENDYFGFGHQEGCHIEIVDKIVVNKHKIEHVLCKDSEDGFEHPSMNFQNQNDYETREILSRKAEANEKGFLWTWVHYPRLTMILDNMNNENQN